MTTKQCAAKSCRKVAPHEGPYCAKHGCNLCGYAMLADTEDWPAKLCPDHYEEALQRARTAAGITYDGRTTTMLLEALHLLMTGARVRIRAKSVRYARDLVNQVAQWASGAGIVFPDVTFWYDVDTHRRGAGKDVMFLTDHSYWEHK